MNTPAAEGDTLFREVLASSTVAIGDEEAVQMGVTLGVPEVLKGLSSSAGQNDKLKAVIADGLAVFKC